MSLNLVSEQLLSANGLNHQDLLPFLASWPSAVWITAISIFSRAITNPGFWKTASLKMVRTILTRRRRSCGQRRENGFCLCRPNQSTGAGAERAGGSYHRARQRRRQSAYPGAVEYSALYTSIDPLQSMSREENWISCAASIKRLAPLINACRKCPPA